MNRHIFPEHIVIAHRKKTMNAFGLFVLRFMAYHTAHMDKVIPANGRVFTDKGMAQHRRIVSDRCIFFNDGIRPDRDVTAKRNLWT